MRYFLIELKFLRTSILFQMQVRHGGVNELERDFNNLSFEHRDVSTFSVAQYILGEINRLPGITQQFENVYVHWTY